MPRLVTEPNNSTCENEPPIADAANVEAAFTPTHEDLLESVAEVQYQKLEFFGCRSVGDALRVQKK